MSKNHEQLVVSSPEGARTAEKGPNTVRIGDVVISDQSSGPGVVVLIGSEQVSVSERPKSGSSEVGVEKIVDDQGTVKLIPSGSAHSWHKVQDTEPWTVDQICQAREQRDMYAMMPDETKDFYRAELEAQLAAGLSAEPAPVGD